MNSVVNTKNSATPKISSGMTKDRIITKLAEDEVHAAPPVDAQGEGHAERHAITVV